ncbi:hypothetical protein ACOME3_002329 [Neoechinorhynchus agilis]
MVSANNRSLSDSELKAVSSWSNNQKRTKNRKSVESPERCKSIWGNENRNSGCLRCASKIRSTNQEAERDCDHWDKALDFWSTVDKIPEARIIQVNQIHEDPANTQSIKTMICEQFPIPFDGNSRAVKSFEASFAALSHVQGPVHKARRVPFSLYHAVGEELERLVKDEILVPVDVAKNELTWSTHRFSKLP